MHASARQAAILRALAREGSCSVMDLASQLSVSDETIRRDIKAMAAKGLLERVHGGAILPDILREPDFQKRMAYNAEAKARIARAVAREIRNGDSIFVDTGSTTLYVARALGEHSELMVVTNGADIARTLAQSGRNKVYLAGGEIRSDDGAVLGGSAVRFVESFRVRTAVLSVGAVQLEDGCMDFHLNEADLAQVAIRRASRVIVVADHSKFGAQAAVRVCDFSQISALVTDRPPPAPFARRLEEAGVELVVA